jgi:hypothetical protein
MVEEQRGKEVPIELVEGLSEAMVSKLQAAGLKTLKDVLEQGEDGLLQIKGIGEKTAKRIWALIQERESGSSGTKPAKSDEPEEEEDETRAEAEDSVVDGEDVVEPIQDEPRAEKQSTAEAVEPAELEEEKEETAAAEEIEQDEKRESDEQPAATVLESVSEDNQKGEN